MTTESSRCVCIEVRTAAQKLTRLYDEALADVGITVTQLSELNTIREMGAPTLTELAQVTELDRSTLGRNLKLLQNRGLVSMAPGHDARTRKVKLTRAGTQALKKGAPLWFGVQSALINRIGPEKRQLLQELLTDLTSPETNDHA